MVLSSNKIPTLRRFVSNPARFSYGNKIGSMLVVVGKMNTENVNLGLGTSGNTDNGLWE